MTTLHGDCVAPPGARRYCAVCPGTWTSSAGVEHVCEHECHQEDE